MLAFGMAPRPRMLYCYYRRRLPPKGPSCRAFEVCKSSSSCVAVERYKKRLDCMCCFGNQHARCRSSWHRDKRLRHHDPRLRSRSITTSGRRRGSAACNAWCAYMANSVASTHTTPNSTRALYGSLVRLPCTAVCLSQQDRHMVAIGRNAMVCGLFAPIGRRQRLLSTLCSQVWAPIDRIDWPALVHSGPRAAPSAGGYRTKMLVAVVAIAQKCALGTDGWGASAQRSCLRLLTWPKPGNWDKPWRR